MVFLKAGESIYLFRAFNHLHFYSEKRRMPSWLTVTFCTSWSIRARLGLEKQESKKEPKIRKQNVFLYIYIQKLLQTKNIRGPTDEQQISESASFLLISITNKTFSLLNRLLVPVIGSID